ncbi:fetuin-B-like [Erythrolamprus reginae]|uniref:fetuin-B-like n=1 Tax=Erythrolamprus reginae TaxID=121349 RepID=UPI00396C3A6C
MSRLISFLIGIQMLHLVVATSPPFPFLFPSCNSLVVKAAAEVALDKVNADQTEGYVLALQRISDVLEKPQWPRGSFFYLILDVVETVCHVLTRKQWKECEIRDLHKIVHGQCKIIIHFNRNSNTSNLHGYQCDLHPISRSDIGLICPDCPSPRDPSLPIFQETALETLDKFNAENDHNHLFRLDKVTKASSQWGIASSNFVEYTIHETSCGKSPPVSDITQCPLLPVETAERGLCKGSVTNTQIEHKKYITVKCDFFPRLPSVTAEQIPQSKEEHHDESGHHHQHSRPHHHKHDGQGQEHQEPQQPLPTAGIQETPSKQKKPVGLVILHTLSSKHPVQEPSATSGPTLASPEQEAEPHSDKATFSFPEWFSPSNQCPGDILINIPGFELPPRPQAETSQTKSDVQH